MLPEVVRLLRCPHCAAGLDAVGRTLRCASGHAFDVARQGHVTLTSGRTRLAGDTAAMVAAREAVLAAGHHRSLVEAVVEAAVEAVTADSGAAAAISTGQVGSSAVPVGALLDVGAGTGHHLAATLDRLPEYVGLALDASPYAARRGARAHPRAGAVVCDVTRPLPVRDGAVAVVLDVFAPRNGPELARVLRPGGALVVVTPLPDHLGELVGPLGLLGVDPQKQDRLASALDPYVTRVRQSEVRVPLSLPREDVVALAAMGPSAWHVDPDTLRDRVSRLDAPVRVTLAAEVAVFRRP
ncbi:MAG: putative RNA methyltransferase [Actinomycetes bacterium]